MAQLSLIPWKNVFRNFENFIKNNKYFVYEISPQPKFHLFYGE